MDKKDATPQKQLKWVVALHLEAPPLALPRRRVRDRTNHVLLEARYSLEFQGSRARREAIWPPLMDTDFQLEPSPFLQGRKIISTQHERTLRLESYLKHERKLRKL